MIEKVTKQLQKHKIRFAIVGGYAVALHGAVRGTLDVDIILHWTLQNLKLVESALEEIGLKPRLPITADDLFHFRDEYIKNKNLIAWNFINPQNASEQVDIIITTDLKEVSVKKVKMANGVLPIISIEDLIEMKQRSGREQDLADIKALRKLLNE